MNGRLLGLSGSLRKGSYNTSLLRAAIDLAPADCRIEMLSIREVPLYDGDVEATSGVPKVVANLKDLVASADGILLSTLHIAGAGSVFDANGTLVDSTVRDLLRAYRAGLAIFVAANKRGS
jgi:hypothetical protein